MVDKQTGGRSSEGIARVSISLFIMAEGGEFVLEEKKGWQGEVLRIWKKNPHSSDVDADFFDAEYDLAVATAPLRVWDGSDFLAAELARDGNVLALEDAVIELGSGVGFLGLYLAQRGHSVLLSDVASIADGVLGRNVKANEQAQRGDEDAFCWDGAVPVGKGSAAVVPLNWRREATGQLSAAQREQLAARRVTVVASECVWLTELLQPLVETLAALLRAAAPGSVALVSYVERSKEGGTGSFLTLPMLCAAIAATGCTHRVVREEGPFRAIQVTL